MFFIIWAFSLFELGATFEPISVPWGGPGWYVLGHTKQAQNDLTFRQIPLMGPFPDEEKCKVYRARWQEADSDGTYSVWCSYKTEAWPDDDTDDGW